MALFLRVARVETECGVLGELAILSGLSRAVFLGWFFWRAGEGELDTIQIFLKGTDLMNPSFYS